MFSRRARFLVLALGTIVVGLLVHLRGAALGPVVQDVIGDALWAAMIFWWIGTVAPGAPLVVRGPVAWLVCAAVEVSQLYHAPALDAFRATTVGHLLLGSGFDVRDLGAYALGVVGAVLVERAIAARIGQRRAGASR